MNKKNNKQVTNGYSTTGCMQEKYKQIPGNKKARTASRKMMEMALLMLLCLLSACVPLERNKEGDAYDFIVTEEIKASKEVEKITESKEIKRPEYVISLDVNLEEKSVVGIERIKFTNESNRYMDIIPIQVPLKAFEKDSPEIPYFQPFQEKIFGSEKVKTYAMMSFGDITANRESVDYYFTGSILNIKLPTPLEPKEQLELLLPFMAFIPSINHRTGANENNVWLGNFIPTLAVNGEMDWFTSPYYSAGDPFFTDISTYTVKVTSPINAQVIGTGDEKIILETPTERIVTFNARLVRDFALAIGTGYQEHIKETKDGVKIHLFHFSYLPPEQIELILGLAVSHMEYLSDYIGIYPYSNYSLVEAGLFLKSGMEYAQLSFIDTERLKDAEVDGGIAHEIAHQWFYNVVGNDQVEAAFLDEGLANYFQKKMTLTPRELESFMVENYNMLQGSLPDMAVYKMTDSIDVYTNWSDYYAVQYMRPMFMLYSLESLMGSEEFKAFVEDYYSQNLFKIADETSFIQSAEKIFQGSLEEFFIGWFENRTLPNLHQREAFMLED